MTYQFVFSFSFSIQVNAISVSRRGVIERPVMHGIWLVKKARKRNDEKRGKIVQQPGSSGSHNKTVGIFSFNIIFAGPATCTAGMSRSRPRVAGSLTEPAIKCKKFYNWGQKRVLKRKRIRSQ